MFPSCSWPVFASTPKQQLDLPLQVRSMFQFPVSAGPVSPSANQETSGSSGEAPGAPSGPVPPGGSSKGCRWCFGHRSSHSCPCPHRGWGHRPEHLSQSSQSSFSPHSSSCSSDLSGLGQEGRAGLQGQSEITHQSSLASSGISPGSSPLPFNPEQDLRNQRLLIHL